MVLDYGIRVCPGKIFQRGFKRTFGGISPQRLRQRHELISGSCVTAIAAQVGTGNIKQVLQVPSLTGGPGSYILMWVIAGILRNGYGCTRRLPRHRGRQKAPPGESLGGLYYIRLHLRAVLKVPCRLLCSSYHTALGFGCMVSNFTGATFSTAFMYQGWTVGVVLVILCGFIFP